SIAKANARARLSSACRHREQRRARSRLDGALDRAYGAHLVGAQAEVLGGFGLELGVRFVDVLLEEAEQAFGRVPAGERRREVLRAARVAEPDAARLGDLLQVRPAIGREEEGDGERSAVRVGEGAAHREALERAEAS